jgi:hypothetical protein
MRRRDRNPAEEALEEVVEETSYVVSFLGDTGVAIVRNIVQTLGRALGVVLPVAALSLLSMLIMLVLSKLSESLRHGPFTGVLSLWGMTLTILVAVVILCGIAFDLGPPLRGLSDARQTGDVQQTGGVLRSAMVRVWRLLRRMVGVRLAVIAAGSLLGGLGYFLISLTSAALLPMVWPAASGARRLVFADLYFVNLLLSVAALGMLAGLSTIVRVRRPGRAPRPFNRLRVSAAVILVITAATSVLFGVAPIGTTLAFVTGPYAPAATHDLRDRIPPPVAASCAMDVLLLPGQAASLSCRAAGGTDVSYHLFGSTTELDHWYGDAVEARGLGFGHGSCAGSWPAEGVEPNGSRVACYVDRRGAWLLWTDSRSLVLGIACRADGRADALFTSWSTGQLSLRPS